MTLVIRFEAGLRPILKHQEHDQSSHGSWAKGSQGATSNLSDDEIRDVIYNSKTVNEMFDKVANRLGKSMKPSVDNLSEDEITHYRGVSDVSRMPSDCLMEKLSLQNAKHGVKESTSLKIKDCI
jgi:hypothetical protein